MWAYRLTLATCVLLATCLPLNKKFLSRVGARHLDAADGDVSAADADAYMDNNDFDMGAALSQDDAGSVRDHATLANDDVSDADDAAAREDDLDDLTLAQGDVSQVGDTTPMEDAAGKDEADMEDQNLSEDAASGTDQVDEPDARDDTTRAEDKAPGIDKIKQAYRTFAANDGGVHLSSGSEDADDDLEVVSGCDDATIDCETAEIPETITDVVSGCDDATVDCESPQDLSGASMAEEVASPMEIVSGCDDATVDCEAADDTVKESAEERPVQGLPTSDHAENEITDEEQDVSADSARGA